MNIVLFEPEIPQNTGNVARTCSVIGSKLHLVKPLGFSVNDRTLKRAGLDYWHFLDVSYYDNITDLWRKNTGNTFYYVSTKGSKSYTDIKFSRDDFIVFGKETAGLPGWVLENNNNVLRIPMKNEQRSLNLSNAVAIVAYEALRQQGFPGLE